MSTKLVVNGNTYNYPDPGENPNWGEQAAEWAEAVTIALASIINPGDILENTFSISNNLSIAANVNGLIFDSSLVRSSLVSYNIYRISTSTQSGNTESGNIYLNYDDNASSGNKWSFSQIRNGSAGVALSILDNGQVQYKTTDIGSLGYSGSITFSAKTIAK